MFLKSDGSLWGMGRNDYGPLGDGTTNNISTPEQIVSSNVVAIAAGLYHSLFLKANGSLWVMGWNFLGQLGNGTTNNISMPEQIVASNVVAIAGAEYHSLYIKSDGSLWAMGGDGDGQLGDGLGHVESLLPEQVFPVTQPVTTVTSIAAGEDHSLFIKSDGSLWAMGYSQFGQLGDGALNFSTNRPEQIVSGNVVAAAAGVFHSRFRKSDGSLWAMGGNAYGQLGDGTVSQRTSPKQIVSS